MTGSATNQKMCHFMCDNLILILKNDLIIQNNSQIMMTFSFLNITRTKYFNYVALKISSYFTIIKEKASCLGELIILQFLQMIFLFKTF